MQQPSLIEPTREITAKAVIYLFPDYASTGLWDSISGCNVDPTALGVSPMLKLAVQYWHYFWELALAAVEDEEEFRPPAATRLAFERDGEALAQALSAENERYIFIYKSAE